MKDLHHTIQEKINKAHMKPKGWFLFLKIFKAACLLIVLAVGAWIVYSMALLAITSLHENNFQLFNSLIPTYIISIAVIIALITIIWKSADWALSEELPIVAIISLAVLMMLGVGGILANIQLNTLQEQVDSLQSIQDQLIQEKKQRALP